jgi:hypothetical protein
MVANNPPYPYGDRNCSLIYFLLYYTGYLCPLIANYRRHVTLDLNISWFYRDFVIIIKGS